METVVQVRPIFGIIVLARETVRLLARDRIFVPALVGSLVMAAFANLASDWSVEEFRKILFDIGALGFQLTGVLVGIVWGHKLFADANREGSIEVQLAAPISRTTWLLGKFTGFLCALTFLWAAMVVFWQGLMLLNNFGYMKPSEWMFMVLQLMGWYVVASIATIAGVAFSAAVSLFFSLCIWLSGIVAPAVVSAIAPDTPELSKAVATTFARFWNLQVFCRPDFATLAMTLDPTHLKSFEGSMLYGASLVFLIISISCLILARRDIRS